MNLKCIYMRFKVLLILVILTLSFSCKKSRGNDEIISPTENVIEPPATGDELFSYPSYFPKPVYDFSQNPLTKEKVALGKMLFYDPILSLDSTIACANCHQPFAAFSHPAHSLSHGINREFGIRNAPGLFNLAWMPKFMLDGGINHLDLQSIAPITNPVEMGESLQGVLKKLNQNSTYSNKFKSVWKTEKIESEQLLKSLSQFMLTIVSCKSKYDMYKQGKATLSQQELEGMLIVQQRCSPCHGGELFTDFSIRNIGLDSNAGVTTDLGREMITGQLSDRRKFRSPSLRNFSITAPYLHGGIVYSLSAVLDRHDSLVQVSPSLDPLMIKNDIIGIRLTSEERLKIQAFLLTLTDNTISSNPAFLTPFDKYDPVH